MEKMTLDEMKKIAHQIIEEEEKKYNIKINIFPVTFVEYYKDYVFQKKFSLVKKLSLSLTPLVVGGLNDLKGNTIVFLNYINRIEKIDGKIFRLAEVCFHEARHSEQSQFSEYSYEGLFNTLDHYIKNAAYIDYDTNHDKYSFEIGANIYGIINAKEYLKQNYPDLYKEYKGEIDKREKEYKYDYIMYDASNTIDRFLSISNVINNISSTVNKVKKNHFKETTLSPVLDIFLNEDNSFKNIKDIINNKKFKMLDKRIIYAFLSSQTFLKALNFKELSEDELVLIKESLEYTNGIYKNQEKALKDAQKDNIISKLQFLKSQKSIINKTIFITDYYRRSIKKLFNFTRSENKRKKHIYSVQNYLDSATDELEKRKTRGFLNIGMFYVIGILIVIFTILYFFI